MAKNGIDNNAIQNNRQKTPGRQHAFPLLALVQNNLEVAAFAKKIHPLPLTIVVRPANDPSFASVRSSRRRTNFTNIIKNQLKKVRIELYERP